MITQRQQEILKIIVEEYIKCAKPVGSTSLCERLNCSSATIRSEMGALEEVGYLEKTHTSSGRIPSEKGYRYYVDNLMKPKEITGEDVLKLQRIFDNHSLVLSDVITKSMEIIAEITNCTSVVLGSNSSDNKLKQVEVVPLGNDNIIAIVVTDKGHIEHKSLIIEAGVSAEEIRKVVDLINKLLIGTPLDEISAKLEFEIKPIIGNYVKSHESLYQAFYKVFNDFSNKNHMHMSGKTKLLDYEEFDNVNKVKEIFNKFDDEKVIKSIEAEDGNINIYIGHENSFDDDVSIIKTKYVVDGEEGTIAIVGPKRMDYERFVALLDYIKQNIERQ
ncbi:MAG: heat-inducible transcriptional repressor HrcA [Bacilli bacterium]